jgi:hypothetical protein
MVSKIATEWADAAFDGLCDQAACAGPSFVAALWATVEGRVEARQGKPTSCADCADTDMARRGRICQSCRVKPRE